MSTPQAPSQDEPQIHIIRHGQSAHNIHHLTHSTPYPYPDAPLTPLGHSTTSQITLPQNKTPDLILISPMTRTIQTALNAFPTLLNTTPFKTPVQIWPDLREAHDAICNKGLSRAAIAARFPQFDFSNCPEEWDHVPHSIEGATERAENVRRRLKELSGVYRNIVVVSHRGFIAFLVKGERFEVCECRSYRFVGGEVGEGVRMGVNVDTELVQDFGPTVLVEIEREMREKGVVDA